MAKKNQSAGSVLVIAIGAVVAAIAAIPKEVWIGLGVLVALYLAVTRWPRKARATPKSVPEVAYTLNQNLAREGRSGARGTAASTNAALPALSPQESGRLKASLVQGVARVVAKEPIPIRRSSFGQAPEFSIPPAPMGMSPHVRWIAPGEQCEVHGLRLPGGMLYLGSGRSLQELPDPSLIDVELPIAEQSADVSQRLTDYWASYSRISPEARRTYLQWLADGRRSPNANIGYVFLFFYGLERRALVDAKSDIRAKADLPAIVAEVQRLLGIYGASGSFRRYASNFLSFISLGAFPPRIYDAPPPAAGDGSYELPLALRLGLGQMATDGKPVSADWALAWALSDPNISRKTAVQRCPEQFSTLFKTKYSEVHGEGLRLKVNRTKLSYNYQPASGVLMGHRYSTDIGDIPDVTAVTGPVKKLQEVVDACAQSLDSYSRFLGRNPEKAGTLEALLQLPPSLWPTAARTDLADIKSRIGDGVVVMSFGELSGRLKSAGPLTRDKILGFARALESEHIGIEPDVLAGAKTPKPEEHIVLFATHPEDGVSRTTHAYQAAAVTLDLACAVALADGDASAKELLHLAQHISSWSHLSQAHQKRLKAHLRHQVSQPTSLSALKKKFEPLTFEAKRTIARFLAHLAQVDGIVTPQEVKLLEKVYKALGVDGQEVYSDLHATPSTSPKPTAGGTKSSSETRLALDAERIASLQKETEAVSALLARVFSDAESSEGLGSDPLEAASGDTSAHLLGLDADHSAFARALLTRPNWARDELANLAADMELMLEGALERINDAAFDAHEIPFTEGEDPVEINPELIVAIST